MLEKLKGVFSKSKKLSKNDIIQGAKSSGFSYIGDSLGACGAVSFGYDRTFDVQRLSTEAQQSKNLITKMVGKLGVQFKIGKEITTSNVWNKRVIRVFSDPFTGSFRTFKDKYFTNHFCSGMIIGYIVYNMLGEPSVQILDSRAIRQKFDDYGNLVTLWYNNKKLDLNRIVKQVTQYDPNKQGWGMSGYESIVYDAMSDREASKRNYYFFKNNAMPSVILTLDDDIENPEEMSAAIEQFEQKYKGSEKSHGVLATGGIKEVRTIDISNKDIELLELKKFAIKKIGVIFGFDPRFLGYKDDANGSHAEYQLMAGQSDKSMVSFADILEEFMMKVMDKLYPNFSYGIELLNDQFVDVQMKQELILKKVEKGLCTLKQGIIELGYSTAGLPEEMDTYILNTQWNSIENIFGKSKLEQKKIVKETKEIGKETAQKEPTNTTDEKKKN